MIFSEQREERGWHKHKIYVDLFTSHMRDEINQLARQMRRLVQIWDTEEMELPSEVTESASNKGRKLRFLRQLRRASRVVCAFFVNHISIYVELKWCIKYVGGDLELFF